MVRQWLLAQCHEGKSVHVLLLEDWPTSKTSRQD